MTGDLDAQVSGLVVGKDEALVHLYRTNYFPDAHIYFMRRLLHDFYNSTCVDILRNTASAMGPDSRVVVCDMLVPDKVDVDGPQDIYVLDFALMCVGGKEKTLREFRSIFDQAGLELVHVYPSAVGSTVMVEGRLKRA